MKSSLLTVVLVLLVAGCSGGERECSTTSDCFAGEVCRADETCGDPIEDAGRDSADDDSDAADAAGGDDTSTADTGEEDASSADTSTGDDAGGDPDASVDAGTDAAPTGPCYWDPFDACEDDEDPDNNAFPGEMVTNMSRGCVNDEFKPMDMTISGRICPLDPMDMYGFTFVECFADDPGFVIEAILDVADDCDPDDIVFDVSGIGETCADPGSQVQCETLGDGRRRIRVLFPGEDNASVGSIRFFVEAPERDDIEFEYDLQLVVRR